MRLCHESAFPDLAAEVYLKCKEVFYFIEVKTENSRLYPHQKEGLKKAREMGLVPVIARVKTLNEAEVGRCDSFPSFESIASRFCARTSLEPTTHEIS